MSVDSEVQRSTPGNVSKRAAAKIWDAVWRRTLKSNKKLYKNWDVADSNS